MDVVNPDNIQARFELGTTLSKQPCPQMRIISDKIRESLIEHCKATGTTIRDWELDMTKGGIVENKDGGFTYTWYWKPYDPMMHCSFEGEE